MNLGRESVGGWKAVDGRVSFDFVSLLWFLEEDLFGSGILLELHPFT